VEPAAQIARSVIGGEGVCHVLGTARRAGAADAAFANAVAAHALDFDDMCFVSMAHPSCALVPAALASAEMSNASGRVLVDGYVAGFELECRLGAVMNPRHYHSRGWHCTSSIGTVGAAAAAARARGEGFTRRCSADRLSLRRIEPVARPRHADEDRCRLVATGEAPVELLEALHHLADA